MSKKLIYICSPLRGDYESNIENAETYCRLVMKFIPNAIPIAPHIYFTRFLHDTDEEERRLGMAAGIELLDKCDELWAFDMDAPSEGMRAEIEYAKERGIPVKDGNIAISDHIIKNLQGGIKCNKTET